MIVSFRSRFLILLTFVILLHSSFAFNFHQLKFEKEKKIWALLVAGSNDYTNYRHQADVCHAYHVLHRQNIPDERIVVMMYDDIAFNKQNPTKGVIINRPNGKNVYKDVPKDYTKNDVTPANFLNILQGNKTAMKNIGSGKVIDSDENDHIFVYFTDHGAPGMVTFPNAEMYATDLNKVLIKMHQRNKFEKMVIYVEACESGSMFENVLPNNINVFAATAANPREPSFACYFDEQRQTYLGDVFSVKWLEDSERRSEFDENIENQLRIIREETNTSHVQEYGDLSIAAMKVSEFQGPTFHIRKNLPSNELEAIPSHEVPVMSLKRRIMSTNSIEENKRLQKHLDKMLRNRHFLLEQVKSVIEKVVFTETQVNQILTKKFALTDLKCYEDVAKHFSRNCFSPSKNDYALRYMYTLVNLCETGISARNIKRAIDDVCVLPPIHGIV